MGKITIEVKINTFGTMLYSLNHPSLRLIATHHTLLLLSLLAVVKWRHAGSWKWLKLFYM